MKNLFTYLTGLFIVAAVAWSSCQKQIIVRPIPIQNLDTLLVPFQKLAFEAKATDWKADLYTFTLPVKLSITYTKTGFYLDQKVPLGIIEGPGQLVLRSGDQQFVYPVQLRNKAQTTATTIDFRSPKTVNPDSSLLQQKILIATDSWLNLRHIPGTGKYFQEEQLELAPKTGIFRAQEDIPLSAYYVQSGSTSELPVRYTFRKKSNRFEVVAGPLKDHYGNGVADGTLVNFIYDDGQYIHRIEAMLLKGYARADIPVPPSGSYVLYATVNETRSSTIHLNPN